MIAMKIYLLWALLCVVRLEANVPIAFVEWERPNTTEKVVEFEYPSEGQIFWKGETIAIKTMAYNFNPPQDGCTRLLVNSVLVGDSCDSAASLVSVDGSVPPGTYFVTAVLVDPNRQPFEPSAETSITIRVVERPSDPVDELREGTFIDCREAGEFEYYTPFIPKPVIQKPSIGCLRVCNLDKVCYNPEANKLVFLYGDNLHKGSDIFSYPPPHWGTCNGYRQASAPPIEWYEDVWGQLYEPAEAQWFSGTTIAHWLVAPPEGVEPEDDMSFFHFLTEEIAGLYATMEKHGHTFFNDTGKVNLFILGDERKFDLNGLNFGVLTDSLLLKSMAPRGLTCFERLVVGTGHDRMLRRSVPVDKGGRQLPLYDFAPTRWTRGQADRFRHFIMGRFDLDLENQPATSSATRVVRIGVIANAKRPILSLDAVVDGLRRGFGESVRVELLDFEQAHIRQQIGIVRGLDVLVSVYGGGLSHALFMRPNTCVVEIMAAEFKDRLYQKLVEDLTHAHYLRADAAFAPSSDAVHNYPRRHRTVDAAIAYRNDLLARGLVVDVATLGHKLSEAIALVGTSPR